MRACYADPPYVGLARYYPEKTEVDHADLVKRLESEFDSWALSLHSPSLRYVLTLCPPSARVMAWVKPFASFKPSQRVAYAWEPVIVKADWLNRDRSRETARDWVAANIALKRGMCGAKPRGFCFWLFEVLGLGFDDEFVDLFPGTGGVSEAWEFWRRARFSQPVGPLFEDAAR